MKVKLEFFKCMGIMLANLCHSYILSTTVLSDDVKTNKFFGLEADEVADTSGWEKRGLVFRYYQRN